jgi:SAM-dependent methyltransferase
VAVYHLRPPYPGSLFERLSEVAADGPVLDAGCGTGDLARGLAPRVERVDAVDASPRMIERARQLPGAERVRWHAAPIEDAELDPPYALIVAGDSVHWFDWDVAFTRFAAWLAPAGTLAIVQREWFPHVEGARGRLRPSTRAGRRTPTSGRSIRSRRWSGAATSAAPDGSTRRRCRGGRRSTSSSRFTIR